MTSFRLLEGMQLGVASAATQIEGGNKQNSWYDWFKKGYIKDNADPSIATMHYELFEQDSQLMHDMGIRHYRLGIEWARLEPKNGVFDEAEFIHYRKELLLLKRLGITPLLTIHHFTNPLWFEKMGAFKNKKCIAIYLRFVKKVVRAFGDLVSEYITINEPNVYATSGYFFGIWPPGKKSIRLTLRVHNHMAECHVKAYTLIHKQRKEMGFDDTKVSYAHHMRVFAPKNPKKLWHRMCTPVMERLFQSSISKTYLTGKGCFPLKRIKNAGEGPFCDFHAINYYSRTAVSGFGTGFMDDVPVNDLGWEIYPEGIVQNARALYKLAELPIYITENGTCDEKDTFRCRYLFDHLKALCESGLPIERYYHWCFADNFEWVEGYTARFGIVHVDFKSQQRTVKRSGEFYTKMIEAHGVTQEIFDEYCDAAYNTNTRSNR